MADSLQRFTNAFFSEEKLALTFYCNSSNENVWIFIKISLNFVLKGPVDNESAMVQVMTFGANQVDKLLPEPLKSKFNYISIA